MESMIFEQIKREFTLREQKRCVYSRDKRASQYGNRNAETLEATGRKQGVVRVGNKKRESREDRFLFHNESVRCPYKFPADTLSSGRIGRVAIG